jgi:DNA polymerase-1
MDFQALGATAAQSAPAEPVKYKNRILQADADVFAYNCSNVGESLAYACNELESHIEQMRLMAGAAHINLHLTMGMKTGREQMATVKPYQENRSNRDPELTQRVWELRHWMANYSSPTVTPVVNTAIEADDSLAQYQLQRIEEHGENSSIIMSIDKDLWMVEGLHIDPISMEQYRVKGYGETRYKEVGNTKPKLVGRGTSWFWHQLIMGDKADNIPGLPMLEGHLCERYIPLKRPNSKRKALACGEAKAVAILDGVTTDKEACYRVLEAYNAHYQNGLEMMVEQAYLLWMNRTGKLTDVLLFLKECGCPVKFSTAQKQRLHKYLELMKVQEQQ